MAWHDLIFVVRDGGPVEKEYVKVHFINMIPIPGQSIGHIIGDDLRKFTAYSARLHDSNKFSVGVRELEKMLGDRRVYLSIGL